MVFFIPSRRAAPKARARRISTGRLTRTRRRAQRLLTADGDVAGSADSIFADIRVSDRHGSSPIGAIAAAPISYRLIAKPAASKAQRHRASPVYLIGWPHARARAVAVSVAADFYFAIIRSATGGPAAW